LSSPPSNARQALTHRFRLDTHSAFKAMTIQAGATAPSPVTSNARPRHPARSTNVSQTPGIRPATILRRRRIAIQAARLFLPFPSARRPTDTPRSVSLPNFLMWNESGSDQRRPVIPRGIEVSGGDRSDRRQPHHLTLPSRTIGPDTALWCFDAGQNVLPCSCAVQVPR
jgi:hypothetical protein